MRIRCPHCSKKAVITSTNVLNDAKTIHNLYCACSDSLCGATFVFCLSYGHTINPPVKTTVQIALALVKRMSEEEKTAL
jgi:Ogr/Delta-like zinc finger